MSGCVFRAVADKERLRIAPDPDEVRDVCWVSPDVLREEMRRRSALLADGQKRLAGIDALMILDAAGTVASRASPPIGTNFSDRGFFRHFGASYDRSIFISAPEKSAANGQWTSFVTRGLSNRNGGFVGLVVAQLSLAYLEEFYRLAMPAERSISVLRGDGLMLLRYPHSDDDIGKRVPDRASWHAIVAEGGGIYDGPDHFSATQIVASVRPLKAGPLVVCNQRYRELYGLPPDATGPGTSLTQLVDRCVANGMFAAESRSRYLALLQSNARLSGPSQFVVELADGRAIAVQQRTNLHCGWVATHEDITERGKIEAALNAETAALRREDKRRQAVEAAPQHVNSDPLLPANLHSPHPALHTPSVSSSISRCAAKPIISRRNVASEPLSSSARRAILSSVIVVILRSGLRLATQPYRKSPRWPPGQPPPDSWRSLRSAGRPPTPR